MDRIDKIEDIGILKMVQSVAIKILQDDPKLEKTQNSTLKDLIKDKFSNRIEI